MPSLASQIDQPDVDRTESSTAKCWFFKSLILKHSLKLSLPTKLSFAGAKKNTMGVFLTSRTCPTIVVTQRNAKLSQKELSKITTGV